MDEEAALLPDTALTTGSHAEVLLAPLATTTRALDGISAERLLSWTRWTLLSIILFRVFDLAHKSFWMLVGTGMNMWLKRTRKEVGKVKDESSLGVVPRFLEVLSLAHCFLTPPPFPA